MAIQNRRGRFEDFNPEELLAGELAVVQEGDTASSTGRSLYICFQPGIVKRIADYEDIQDMVADVAEGYIQDFDDAVDAVTVLIPRTEQAAESAEQAAEAANAIVSAGNSALGHAYGVCSTAYGTSAKTVSIDDFQLVKGGLVSVRFTNGSSNLYTLNVNNTGAKTIKYRNITNMSADIGPDDTVIFQYDGTYFEVVSIERAEPITLDCGTISSLPTTKTSQWINRHMVCLKAELGDPSAQTGDWTVTTSDGSLTISGDINGSTSLSLVLAHAQSITAS
jgi:hypothetical protein